MINQNMEKQSIFAFILIILLNVIKAEIFIAKNNCTKLLRELSDTQRRFVGCVTENGVPVTLCIVCEPHHLNMTEKFNEIQKDAFCSQQIFNHDRLNIVGTTNTVLTSLWTKPLCDLCFTNNNSENFNNKYTAVTSCFENTHGKDPCKVCLNEYLDLNDFYINLDQHNNGQVCYDFQDKMNSTRMQWSHEYKCCHRTFNKTLFLLAVSIVGVLTISFYSGAIILTRRRERNHDLLNSDPVFDEPTTSSVARSISNTNQANGDSQLANGYAERAPVAKKDLKKSVVADDDDDDDDEDDDFYTSPIQNLKNIKHKPNNDGDSSSSDEEPAIIKGKSKTT